MHDAHGNNQVTTILTMAMTMSDDENDDDDDDDDMMMMMMMMMTMMMIFFTSNHIAWDILFAMEVLLLTDLIRTCAYIYMTAFSSYMTAK